MTSADEIADGVVELYNDIASKVIEFEAVNPDDVPEFDLGSGEDAAVQVYGFAEDETPETLGDDMLRATRVVRTLVMVRKVDGVTKKTFLEFVNQLKDSFRNVEIEGFAWEGNEQETIYDFDVLKTKGCFLTGFNSTFQMFG